MLKLFHILLIFVFCLACMANMAFTFDNQKEYLEAMKKVDSLKDIKLRSEIRAQIKIGNIDTMERLEQALQTTNLEYGYYGSIDPDARDENLKIQLGKLIRNHVSLGYDEARKVMYGIVDNENGKVDGVYTGRKYSYPGNGNRDQKRFLNCEHVWPQSFFDKKEPMRSDIHHLMSADNVANGERGSYPFSTVRTAYWSEAGSKHGIDKNGRQCFEPRDCRKGDIARAMFYFSVRYNTRIKDFEEAELRRWHTMDPPDEKEKKRNDSIEKFQKNRNPFIDHPEMVDKISDF